MIDSHCHLAADAFSSDLSDVLARAKAVGVQRMISIGDTMEESKKCLELVQKYEQIFCTIGVHPHHAKDWVKESEESEESDETEESGNSERIMRRMISSSDRVRGVGEIGLDYHYDFSPRETQRKVFEAQLRIAKELKLPAVIHCREAVEDVWAIVDAVKPPKLVMHCCSEKWEDVERFVDRGYFLSFTGIATFPKSDEIRRTIEKCPLSQLMIETDAPFLAPIPHRGKRNEPAFVVEVAKCVAEIKKLSVEEIDEATTGNAVEFFGLPQ